MLHYFARRILIGFFTLALITLVLYGLIRNMPGDPLSLEAFGTLDPGQQVSRDHYEAMRKDLGLDRHWTVGYFAWLGALLRGDLGNSLVGDRATVTAIIAPRIGPTLLLSVSSLALAYLLSIPLGLWCGVRSGTWQERTLTTLLYMLYSLPSFVAALYLLIVFSVRLDWFPRSGLRSNDGVYAGLSATGKAWDILRHLALPVVCSAYASLAYYVRFIRSNLQEVIRQDYIRTARAKGLPERTVVLKHAFRNTLIPLATLFGLTLTSLLSGSVILERIFGWPGIGQLFFERISQRDYPVIMGLVLIFSILVLAGNLLADLLYALVDPRITYS